MVPVSGGDSLCWRRDTDRGMIHRRLWVVQEVLMAPEANLGTRNLSISLMACVFVAATRYCVAAEGLSVLECVTHRSERDLHNLELPSWASRWDRFWTYAVRHLCSTNSFWKMPWLVLMLDSLTNANYGIRRISSVGPPFNHSMHHLLWSSPITTS